MVTGAAQPQPESATTAATVSPAEPHRGASATRRGSRVVVVGGGPGGYEAALVARQLGSDVTLVERRGVGGAAVLTDVVPSKTLIATAEWLTLVESADELGIRIAGSATPAGVPTPDVEPAVFDVDLGAVNERVRALAEQQSNDIAGRLEREGIRIIHGSGRLSAPDTVVAEERTPGSGPGREHRLDADVVLVSTGVSPRVLPTAVPDGERILTWTQVYNLTAMPERLVVVGSGVTGAEFAGAFAALGADVVLVSSRDRVLPGNDADAAELIEDVFCRRGMTVMANSRAVSATRHGDEVVVELQDGRSVTGSHCLMAVGGVPNTAGLGLHDAGVELTPSGHVLVDRVSRTTTRGIYAAGDVTGVFPLASVAATQGRVAMWHALGDAVSPLDTSRVPATVFTSPEIATVGIGEAEAAARGARVVTVPLPRNPRAKMLDVREGFIKLIAREGDGTILGGVVVGPRASELIYPITLAVANRRTADQLANSMTIYPSLSGSIAEAARQLHEPLHS